MRNHRNPRKRSGNYTIDDLKNLAAGRWLNNRGMAYAQELLEGMFE